MIVRKYKSTDAEMLKSWWNDSGLPFSEEFIPETTWILVRDDVPAYSLGLFTTNCKAICYLENFIKNPNLESNHNESKFLFDWVNHEAKKLGFKRTVIWSQYEMLSQRYEELGMNRTIPYSSIFCKELE